MKNMSRDGNSEKGSEEDARNESNRTAVKTPWMALQWTGHGQGKKQ
jgi:hypothetical protein